LNLLSGDPQKLRSQIAACLFSVGVGGNFCFIVEVEIARAGFEFLRHRDEGGFHGATAAIQGEKRKQKCDTQIEFKMHKSRFAN
jgi:hypothetical protein